MDSPCPLGYQESSSDEGRTTLALRMETRKLSRFISRRKRDKAVELCTRNPRLLRQGMTNSKDTALHVAINENKVDVVEKLIGIIEGKKTNQALIAQNKKDETPLHCAAARGSVRMCELILRAGSNMDEDLLGIPNKWNENPIFVAVVHNRKLAFIYLYDAACKKGEDPWDLYRYLVIRDPYGRDLAFYIINKCPELSQSFNAKGLGIQVDPLKYDPNPTSKTSPGRKSSNIFSLRSAHKKQGEDPIDKVENITNRALLAAAETGVIEVAYKILRRFPGIIPEDTVGSTNKNILMAAVENQQTEIFVALRQLMYVKSFVPSHYLFLKNEKDETPAQIFTRDHRGLVEKGNTWLKDTSQSCSVAAALVAGVLFATSRSIPGSIDAKGKPTLEGHPAFQLFAISGLIGLGFSVTALIMFLSILTSRKQPIDFKRGLPLKLLLGLSSLFVSIASMFISFCASHFFVLEDKFKKGIFPLYAVTCLPISFYAIAQFPLYMNLMKAIVKDVPQSQKYVQL
ncbi:uncharacterized protein LOC114737643 [Neltuma alba]|uniref:uncharacterized protein LOC114737643 n=1 Tax=Neltuma alba TaxID=207710 RepID=UPI0010A37AF1|nr:uncharacterized protein LOC114737643 [Prosopis alba]